MMNERRAHHIGVFESDAGLARRLRAALREDDGLSRFAVVSVTYPQELELGRWDLLIIDTDGHTNESLDFLRQCQDRYPHVPTVVLVHQGDTSTAVAATKAGAVDCLEKPLETRRLQSAVRAILSNSWLPEQCIYKILTKAEVRVLELILAGKKNFAIAHELHRSRRTIETHRRNLMRKLGATGLVDLVRRAFSVGFIPPDVSTGISAAESVQSSRERSGAVT